jgi:murein DD-endopeptidase MepM/ murein hydrolase activator NlpD
MSSQTKLIKDIMSLYESILENRNVLEAPNASDELLGGSNVVIPSDGAHAGQSGWQSNNAWDIKGNVGTPVYALADGVAVTFNDYGQNVTKTQGKKLYGQSFTVKSNGGLPGVYYTHLKDSPITKGAEIKCGQFLGYIMDFPNSDFDHVHIGVERGNIKQFLNADGTIKCAKGQKIDGGKNSSKITTPNSSLSTTSSSYEETKPDALISSFAKTVSDFFGLDEQKNNKNLKIKSPTYSKKLEENLNKIKNLLK